MREPLTPPDCDLRDFAYMGVDITRLFGSEFNSKASDGEWRAGMTLWLKSFHQVPSASIPNDDAALARLVELGRDVKTWRKVRTMALHGWLQCSDGRLYHPVVAEKALQAWVQKLSQRKASAAGNATKHKLSFDPKPYDTAIDDAVGRLHKINPSFKLVRRLGRASRTPPTGSPNGREMTEDEAPNGIH